MNRTAIRLVICLPMVIGYAGEIAAGAPEPAVNFGPKTSDEMCFNLITVYPHAAATKTCEGLF